HPAIRRIFDRHEPEIRLPAINLFKHRRDARDRHQFYALAKAVNRRQVAIAIGRAEVRHAERFFERTRTADQLAKHGTPAPFWQGPFAERKDPAQYFVLAGRGISRHARVVLDVADLVGVLGPLVHQLDELLIDLVDLDPQRGDRRRARGTSGG